jgi:hypothetical protein
MEQDVRLRSRPFLLPGKKAMSVYEEAGWAPELFWKALERNISIPAETGLQTFQLMGI